MWASTRCARSAGRSTRRSCSSGTRTGRPSTTWWVSSPGRSITPKVRHERRPITHKDSYALNITGRANVLALATMLRPYTITKMEQWHVVDAWCRSRLIAAPGTGYSDDDMGLVALASTMNRRGKP